MAFSTFSDLRAARNQALSDCDFYMLSDFQYHRDLAVPHSALIMLYRQALRDLPALAEEQGLENTELPTLPELPV